VIATVGASPSPPEVKMRIEEFNKLTQFEQAVILLLEKILKAVTIDE